MSGLPALLVAEPAKETEVPEATVWFVAGVVMEAVTVLAGVPPWLTHTGADQRRSPLAWVTSV